MIAQSSEGYQPKECAVVALDSVHTLLGDHDGLFDDDSQPPAMPIDLDFD